jgi:membrane associated rhomboid family serine protease
MPPITRAIIVTNVVVFLMQNVLGPQFSAILALWPLGAGFMPWQLLTYGFLHGGISHILFNMYGLYLFGAEIERHWGEKRFLNYYMTCVLSAGLAQLVTASLSGAVYPTWGASGGVFGVLMAYGLMFPSRIILPLFPPIPMRAMTFVMVYGALELFLGVTGTQQGVAHFAHLGGMLGGYLLYRRWTAGSPRR